jgi:hypothetical protein
MVRTAPGSSGTVCALFGKWASGRHQAVSAALSVPLRFLPRDEVAVAAPRNPLPDTEEQLPWGL